MTAPFKNVATFFANMKLEKGNVKMGKCEQRFSSTSSCQWNPPPNCFWWMNVNLLRGGKARNLCQRVWWGLSRSCTHTHSHIQTANGDGAKAKLKHKSEGEGEGKRKPHPLRGKAIGKACAVGECCEIRRRRRQRRWQRSCDWCALWKMASIMRCAATAVVVVVFGACPLARHGANNKEYGKV